MKVPQSLRKANAKHLKHFALLILGASLAGTWNLAAQEPAQESAKEVRTIKLLQDDAQVRFASKLYELKYTKPTDVRPFILAAVTRYSARSKVDRVNNNVADKHYLLVSTGEDFIPYVDKLIAGLDVPGKQDEFGSIIEGTGVTRVTYHPQYRLGTEMLRIVSSGCRVPKARSS